MTLTVERTDTANEVLIARFKEMYRAGKAILTDEQVLELLRIVTKLMERGFWLTEDEENWLPPFTPDVNSVKI